MSQAEGLTDEGLRTPRAAAVAGVVFSLLTLASFGLLWSAIPADPQASGGWLAANTTEVALALNLIPFAGIAFLWFIGVIRDRLGALGASRVARAFLVYVLPPLPRCSGWASSSLISPRRNSLPR
jgi:hypothetical protein